MAWRREYHREYGSGKRASERDIVIPPVAEPERRRHAETGPYEFLETYFSDRFYGPWTSDRRMMVDEIRYRAKYGGDKAIAAPRGEGKTTYAELAVGIDAVVTGLLRYPLICASTGPDAERILSNIKAEYEFNELLAADYPEVCFPIVSLEGAPQRANMQTVFGERTRLKWSGSYIVLPTVNVTWCPDCYIPGDDLGDRYRCQNCRREYREYHSVASGAIVESRGLDGAIRGLRRGSMRPDFVIIDDAETRESARSSTQIQQREKTIDEDIAGLGGGNKPVARLLLCTIMNTMCLSAKYTDRSQKPSWDGNRLALVQRWPERKDLWEKYIEIRQNGMRDDPPDKLGRIAHQFYLDNREDMDAGCVVSNPERFNADILEDGSQRESSTIEHVHNAAADKGWDYVFNELQNDPQDDQDAETSQLSPGIITGTHKAYRGRLSGSEAGECPTNTRFLTCFVDVQWDKIYFSVSAWTQKGQRHVIDYGPFGEDIGEGMDRSEATIQRICSLKSMMDEHPYTLNGEPRVPDVTLVDSGDGNTMTAVYTACLITGWTPSKASARWKKPVNDRSNRGPDPWNISKVQHEGRRLGLCHFETEFFRHLSRDSWLVEPGKDAANCVFLFGDNPATHKLIGLHMDVRFDRRYDEKKGWIESWVEPRNHDLWDCDYGNFVAKSMAESDYGKSRVFQLPGGR